MISCSQSLMWRTCFLEALKLRDMRDSCLPSEASDREVGAADDLDSTAALSLARTVSRPTIF